MRAEKVRDVLLGAGLRGSVGLREILWLIFDLVGRSGLTSGSDVKTQTGRDLVAGPLVLGLHVWERAQVYCFLLNSFLQWLSTLYQAQI